jgi:hypothetical protein
MRQPLSPALLVLLALGCGGGDRGPADATGQAGDGGAETGLAEDCAPTQAPSLAGCLVVAWTDPEADTRVPEVQRTRYDGEGRRVSSDHRNPDDWEDFTVCTYDWLSGDVPLAEWCVGRSSYRYDWTHDAAGHLTGKRYDAGWDGTVDKTWEFETNAAGQVVHEGQDQDLDGIIDATTTYEWDDAGHLLEERWDYNADGATDYQRSFAYDADGRRISEVVDDDGDGRANRSTTWTYAPDGRLQRVEIDQDGDGQADSRAVHRYEACQLREVETTDSSGVRSLETWTWTPEGRVAQVESDWNSDGVTDARSWYDYACPGGQAQGD